MKTTPNYLRIALNLQGIGINEETCDRILTTIEAINRKGGNFTLSDAVDARTGCNSFFFSNRNV